MLHDRFAKFAALFSLSAYVAGLLATNYFLFRLGESDFWSFRVKFVYAGVFVLLVPCIFFIALLTFFSASRPQPGKNSDTLASGFREANAPGLPRIHVIWKQLRYFIGHRRVLGLLLILYGIYLLVYYPIKNDDSLSIAALGIVYLLFTGMGMAASLLMVLRCVGSATEVHRKVAVITALLIIFGGFATNYIQAYADHFYPFAREQFGGGKGKPVMIWITSQDPDMLVPSKISMPKDWNLYEPGGQLSKPLTLLFERDDYLVFCHTTQKNEVEVLRLRKNLVKGIQVLPYAGSVPPCWKPTRTIWDTWPLRKIVGLAPRGQTQSTSEKTK